MKRMMIVDVGSTTTKALLFEQGEDGWRYRQRGEAATTVEAPFEDVMIGVENALRLLEQRCGIELLSAAEQGGGWQLHSEDFLATSSAGGGLQMVVCGNVRAMTAESAQRAALGGGAILLDVFSVDDGRHHFHRLERLQTLRPDMILLSGGVEGASVISFMVEMCDFIRSARPRPKFGPQHKLPIIYAGASNAAAVIEDLLGDRFLVKTVDNLRPSFDEENLEPTREAIHDVFIEHVMSQAPGYDRLQERVTQALLPTPTAVGEILQCYARQRRNNLLCVDIGGATTDVFSVVNGRYTRSVSANYGMSYSIGNVAASCGIDNIRRWLPYELDRGEIKRRIAAKLLQPISIPATRQDLQLEQATAREALRMAFMDHREITKVKAEKSLFEAELLRRNRMMEIAQIDVIIGSGGVLSHAPQRGQAAAMLIDAFQPVGVTELMVDSVFMMPHLGVFSQEDEAAALQILEQDCLVRLGTVLAPRGGGQGTLRIEGRTSEGRVLQAEAKSGQLICLPLAKEETAELQLQCQGDLQWTEASRMTVRGGVCGLILDARGRPFADRPGFRYRQEWLDALGGSDEA